MARTLKQGSTQFSISPGLEALGAVGPEGQPVGVVLPQIEVQGRYGITDNVELGAKAWLPGVQADVKVALLRPDSDLDGLNLSVDPGVSYFGVGGTAADGSNASITLLTFHLPVLVGYRFGGHELTFGPRVSNMMLFGDGASVSGYGNGFLAGGSVGMALKLGEGFYLTPEVSYLTPLLAVGQVGFFQAGVGFTFGGDYHSSTAPMSDETAAAAEQ